MNKNDPKNDFEFNHEGKDETITQIMDVYASGVIDQPDGQFHLYEENKKTKQK